MAGNIQWPYLMKEKSIHGVMEKMDSSDMVTQMIIWYQQKSFHLQNQFPKLSVVTPTQQLLWMEKFTCGDLIQIVD